MSESLDKIILSHEEAENQMERRDFVPEGEFNSELPDPQKASIRHSINFGLELQKTFPGIAEDYRSDMILDEIVEKYKLVSDKISFSNARNAVWYALRGYEGKLGSLGEDIAVYPGLISKDEYTLIAKRHSALASAKTGRNNVESGRRQFTEKKGIHAQTPEERKEIAKLARITQGIRDYEKVEIDLIKELAELPEYKRKSRINAIKISTELNRRLYEGKEIRTPMQIKKMWFKSKEIE